MSQSINTDKIPVEITVRLGKARLSYAELKALQLSSIIELEKLAGEPLEVFANGVLVAKGESVVVNEKFGVRITELVRGE